MDWTKIFYIFVDYKSENFYLLIRFVQNGEIHYSLVQSEPHCPISVLPITGEMILTSNLDYEDVTRYNLIVKARDQGVPPRHNNVTVILNVLDVNDNFPEFEHNFYEVEVTFFSLMFLRKSSIR